VHQVTIAVDNGPNVHTAFACATYACLYTNPTGIPLGWSRKLCALQFLLSALITRYSHNTSKFFNLRPTTHVVNKPCAKSPGFQSKAP